jgi:putative iron-only hydrogenase system regulator
MRALDNQHGIVVALDTALRAKTFRFWLLRGIAMPVCANVYACYRMFNPGLFRPGFFVARGEISPVEYGQKEGTMERIAVIGAILEKPQESQQDFNNLVSQYRGLIKGRMGIPFDAEDTAVIALTLRGELDDINALTGKLGNLPFVTVKTAVSVRGTGNKQSRSS